MAQTATEPVYWDPYNHAQRIAPYDTWRRLRDEAPVYYNEQHDFYALSRYDDVLNALVDSDTYKSGHGIVLEMITPEPYENIPMMIMKDPPEHTRLRKLVARAFTPRAISDLERRVGEMRFAGHLPPLAERLQQPRHLSEVAFVAKAMAVVLKTAAQSFFIELKPFGTGANKRWLVSYEAPSSGARNVPALGSSESG